jgi:hypothetical protein
MEPHQLLAVPQQAKSIVRGAGVGHNVQATKKPWLPKAVQQEDKSLLHDYADSIAIDMVPDEYRLVTRDGLPSSGLEALDLFTALSNLQLPTRCAMW